MRTSTKQLRTHQADEVTLTVPLPASLERGTLIGKQGAYTKRLEATYDVRINFPKADEASNDITIRGGQKGALAAKKELVDLIEFSKEHGNVVTFIVSVKSLPRILGKAGAQINEIKEETQVSIDIDQASDDAVTAEVTLRGTKAGTQAAKASILAIAKDVDGEARLTLDIPREYHTTLIGSGGQSSQFLTFLPSLVHDLVFILFFFQSVSSSPAVEDRPRRACRATPCASHARATNQTATR